MPDINYTINKFQLSKSILLNRISYTLNKPFIRIVIDDKSKKIPKILLFTNENNSIENIEINRQIATEGEIKNPVTNASSIHCVINVLINDKNKNSEGYKILEVELDKLHPEIINHFHDINSFLTVNCISISNKDTTGTMTIASYQNGGSVDRPPLT